MTDGALQWIKIAALPALPLVAFLAWSNFQAHVSGHAGWMATQPTKAMELNKRRHGYAVTDVREYWASMNTPEAREIERRYLRIDLCFPLIYGGAAIAACLLVLYRLAPHPPQTSIITALVVATIAVAVMVMFADWTENLSQLDQFARFATDGTLEAYVIERASRATRVKLYGVVVAIVMIVALDVLLLIDSTRGAT